MGHAVTQLAAFVDRAGCFRSAMTANPSGKGKLLEELAQPFHVLALIRIDFRVTHFQVCVCESGGGAMTGTRNIDHVQTIFLDEPVQMDPDKTLPRIRPPM